MAISLGDFARISQTQQRGASLDPDPTGANPLRATPKGLGHKVAGVFKDAFTSRTAIQQHAAPKQQLADQFRTGLRAKYGDDVANRSLARFTIDPMRSLKVSHVLKGLGGAAAEHHAASVPARMQASLIQGKPYTFAGAFTGTVRTNALQRVGELSGEITGGEVSSPGGRTQLARGFYKDHVERIDPISIKEGTVTRTITNSDDPDPADALTQFAGSAARAEGLSHLLHQGAMASLVGARAEFLSSSGGGPVVPFGQESPSYTLGRASNGDFIVDLSLTMQPDRLQGGGPALRLDPASSQITCSIQLRITQADLDAGNGHFTVSRQPAIDVQLTPDWVRLAT